MHSNWISAYLVLKYKLGTLLLRLLLKTGPPFQITCSSEPRERSYGAREAGTFSYFEILSIVPASGIEHATSRSAVNRSTDWANPAAVIIISGWVVFSNWPPLLFSNTKRSTLFSSGGCSTCYDHHKLLKGTSIPMKTKKVGSQNQGCSTCKIPCKRACLLLSQFWRMRERPCMNWIRSLLKMCYLLLEYPNPGLTAMRFDTHTFGKQSFTRANKIAYSTNPRVRAWFLRNW